MASNAEDTSKTHQGVTLSVYRHLLEVNVGFDQVVRALAALQENGLFHRRELDHYSAVAKEARATTNSYLTGVLERIETDEAGRRFGKRRKRELREK
jgi:hypothetical protein